MKGISRFFAWRFEKAKTSNPSSANMSLVVFIVVIGREIASTRGDCTTYEFVEQTSLDSILAISSQAFALRLNPIWQVRSEQAEGEFDVGPLSLVIRGRWADLVAHILILSEHTFAHFLC